MPSRPPRWMPVALVLAGVYNLAWGAWAVLFTTHSFANSGFLDSEKPLHYPQLWQCIGMIVGVYGVGYILAARDPARHWPVVLVGFLGKLFGPVGLIFGVATGQTRLRRDNHQHHQRPHLAPGVRTHFAARLEAKGVQEVSG